MTFHIKIATDNAAFDDGREAEIAACLLQVSTYLIQGQRAGQIYDSNGNVVGRWWEGA